MGAPRALVLQAGEVVRDLPRRSHVPPRTARPTHRYLGHRNLSHIDPRVFTVGAFNAHWGVHRRGVLRGRRFDAIAVIRELDADVVVVPEAWRHPDGELMLDELAGDGYEIRSTLFAVLEERMRRPGDVRPAGSWELAVCSRLPTTGWRELPLSPVFRDHAHARAALTCTVEVAGSSVDIVGIHTSSRLATAGPIVHMRAIAPRLPRADGPAVVAGDFNFWGPGVVSMLPGWRRSVRGRTWPAHRPHSQIDHVLVNKHVEVLRGEVLDAYGSDHRPIRALLRIRET
ncbi:MAG: endonuclease/exonuclease/phosphatase family protein [Acidimicrobiia bacterium]